MDLRRYHLLRVGIKVHRSSANPVTIPGVARLGQTIPSVGSASGKGHSILFSAVSPNAAAQIKDILHTYSLASGQLFGIPGNKFYTINQTKMPQLLSNGRKIISTSITSTATTQLHSSFKMVVSPHFNGNHRQSFT
ncbi:hypothetical protein F8388_026543 [Cannabis sativa]|uniref:Uncharacterized protein n=1 Tax=Cannabis sativa TaxID=3483 RepID=A0A7J6E8I0_CANSA|nr:hypothetical protein F8388_026543 [Cannabis sativa]